MNDLETLLRDSLQSAPMPQTGIGDPVAAVERRARRARRSIAGGALALVAVVTAAVVVPMQVTSGSRGGVSRLAEPPSKLPPVPAVHAPQVWFKSGSVAMTSGGGSLWHLHHKVTATKDVAVVDRVEPATHETVSSWDLQEPADFIAYGLGRVWIWGGGDGGFPDGLLQSAAPGSTLSWNSPHQAFNGVAFADGLAWTATGRQVMVLDVSAGSRSVSTIILPAASMQNGIVATQTGEIWVRTAKKWLRIDPASRQVVDSVQWAGPMLGAAGGAAVWTYAGNRLIALSPSLLHQGIAAAEGSRITVPGVVIAVAPSSDGGLFVVATHGQDASTDPSALYYLSERALTGTAGINDQTPNVAGIQPFQLAPDGSGGVNYTDVDAGTRWTP